MKQWWQILIDGSLESKVPCFLRPQGDREQQEEQKQQKTLSSAQHFALADLFLGLCPYSWILTSLLKLPMLGQLTPLLWTFRNVKS